MEDNIPKINFDEDALLLGYQIAKLLLYDAYYNDVDVTTFDDDSPEDSTEAAPEYDFEIIEEMIEEIINRFPENEDPSYLKYYKDTKSCCSSKCCCNSKQCDNINDLQKENDRLRKANQELYQISKSLNESMKILNEEWNNVYEDLLENLTPLIYYLMSQSSLVSDSPYEPEDIKLGKILPKPSTKIKIPTPKVSIPTVNEIKKKIRKISPKVELPRFKKSEKVNEFLKKIRNIKIKLPRVGTDRISIRFKKSYVPEGGNAPLITHIQIATNCEFVGSDDRICRNKYNGIKDRIDREIYYAENIWKNIFKLQETRTYLNYELNTGNTTEEIVSGDPPIYIRETDNFEGIANNIDKYVMNQIKDGVLNLNLVIIYAGGRFVHEEGETDTTSGALAIAQLRIINVNGVTYKYGVIVMSNGAINYESVLAHEIGHILYKTNKRGDLKDPEPDPDANHGNGAHNVNKHNLMEWQVGCNEPIYVTKEQLIKIGESKFLVDNYFK